MMDFEWEEKPPAGEGEVGAAGRRALPDRLVEIAEDAEREFRSEVPIEDGAEEMEVG